MVKTYKLSMSANLYQQLGITISQYSTKEKAIEAVNEALSNAGIEYTFEEVNDIPEFKNSSGGVLVSIVS